MNYQGRTRGRRSMAFAPNEPPSEAPNEPERVDQPEQGEYIELAETVSPDEAVQNTELRWRSLVRMTRHGQVVLGLLVLILLVGGYFRFVGQNWDDYTHLHPDERFLTGVATSIGGPLNPSGNQDAAAMHQSICNDRYPETKGTATSIFDSLCSTWYPKNGNSGTGLYVYGELPLFIVKWTALTMNDLSRADPIFARLFDSQYYVQRQSPRNWDDYNGVHLIGRFISAGAELLSLVFL